MRVDERYCTMYHSMCNEVRLHSPPSVLTEATSSSSRNITLLVCSTTALEGGQEEGGGIGEGGGEGWEGKRGGEGEGRGRRRQDGVNLSNEGTCFRTANTPQYSHPHTLHQMRRSTPPVSPRQR